MRAIVAAMDAAQGDAAAFAALVTPDVSIVNPFGRRVRGHDALRAAMTHANDGDAAHLTRRTDISSITRLGRDVALVTGVKHVTDARESDDPQVWTAETTMVLARSDHGWRLAAAQTTAA